MWRYVFPFIEFGKEVVKDLRIEYLYNQLKDNRYDLQSLVSWCNNADLSSYERSACFFKLLSELQKIRYRSNLINESDVRMLKYYSNYGDIPNIEAPLLRLDASGWGRILLEEKVKGFLRILLAIDNARKDLYPRPKLSILLDNIGELQAKLNSFYNENRKQIDLEQ